MSSTTGYVCYSSRGSKIKFQAEQTFDAQKMRHYVNGRVSVLHCHHYATLFTQLAIDAVDLQGTKHLADTATETFGKILSDYFTKYSVTETCDRIAIAEQYFSFTGLGEVCFEFGEGDGEVTMKHSHVDEGWIKKWGQRQEPVNYIGQGYIKAAWSSVFGKKPGACRVEEIASIVCGNPTSQFNVNW